MVFAVRVSVLVLQHSSPVCVRAQQTEVISDVFMPFVLASVL